MSYSVPAMSYTLPERSDDAATWCLRSLDFNELGADFRVGDNYI